MKRLLIISFAAFSLFAQEAQEPAKPPAAEPEKPAAQEAQPAQEEQAAPTPVIPVRDAQGPNGTNPARPSIQSAGLTESGQPSLFGENVSSSIEVGYRWNGDLSGSLDSYRSIVNLGEGVRLVDFDFNYLAPTRGGWMDRFNVRANGWGGDPYSQVRLEALADRKYRVTFDHRSMAYFNALPSFANPAVERGILFSQSQFDILHRNTDVELELRPGTRFMPFFAFGRNNNFGRGVQNYVADFNEYAVGTDLDAATNNVRGGVRFETNRFHATIEQGYTTFDDGQSLFTGDRNEGNRTTTFMGQRLFLTSLAQRYVIDGSGPYTRGLFTARPFEWLDLYGNFLYSQPETSTSLTYDAAGNFAQTNPLLFYTTSQFALASAAKAPHVNGNGGFELRPFRRLRIVESFMTDRMHTAGNVNALSGSPEPSTEGVLWVPERLVVNYNQNQLEALFDITQRLTIRGGHKYIWGDSVSRAPSLASDLRQFDESKLEINALLAGLTYRITQKFSVYADLEVANGDRAYFQTSLRDYNRFRLRASYQPLQTLTVSGVYSWFENENPGPERTYEFDNKTISANITWIPASVKNLRVIAEYARSNFWSDVDYRIPQTLQLARSYYQEKGHSGTSLVEIGIPGIARAPRVAFGGSLWYSTGTRQSEYYQPLARVIAPVAPHVDLNFEWRWFGFTEPLYIYENFRQHQALFSLRVY
jgi:hypothetical protein